MEAYPLRAEISKEFPFERYMGVLPTFERLGFKEVLSRSKRRPIMRFFIEPITLITLQNKSLQQMS